MATHIYKQEEKLNAVLNIEDGEPLEVYQGGNLAPIASTPTKEITVEGYFGVGMGDHGFSMRNEESGEIRLIDVFDTWADGSDTVIRATLIAS